MVHEFLHALGLGHRHRDQGSIESYLNIVGSESILGMENTLLRLYFHPLVESGMTLGDIRSLIVFRDELLDHPDPPESTPLEIWIKAFAGLQEAGSAQFTIRGELSNCGEHSGSFGWAEYKIANFGWLNPRWVYYSEGETHYYAIDHGLSVYERNEELWNYRSGQWSRATQAELAPDLAWPVTSYPFLPVPFDFAPHDVMQAVYGVEPDDVRMVNSPADEITLEVTADLDSKFVGLLYAPGESKYAKLILDRETFAILGYEYKHIQGDGCVKEVQAKDGRDGIDFSFPGEIAEASEMLRACRKVELGPITGEAHREDQLPGRCRAARSPDGPRNSLIYEFALAEPGIVRVELDRHSDWYSLRLLEGHNTSGVVLAEGHNIVETGRLDPGPYTLEIEAFDFRVSGSPALTIAVSPQGK